MARKQILKRILAKGSAHVLYVDHTERERYETVPVACQSPTGFVVSTNLPRISEDWLLILRNRHTNLSVSVPPSYRTAWPLLIISSEISTLSARTVASIRKYLSLCALIIRIVPACSITPRRKFLASLASRISRSHLPLISGVSIPVVTSIQTGSRQSFHNHSQNNWRI